MVIRGLRSEGRDIFVGLMDGGSGTRGSGLLALMRHYSSFMNDVLCCCMEIVRVESV